MPNVSGGSVIQSGIIGEDAMPAEATRPIALITGASLGIGESLCDFFARAGHDGVLVARKSRQAGG